MSVYIQAMLLLIDRNLEWSKDLETIRPLLCALFMHMETDGDPTPIIQALAEKICSDE
jgi:hypothetical protein